MWQITGLLMGVLVLGAEGENNTAPPKASFEHCLVSAIYDVEVPAQEAGVVTTLTAIAGSQVKAGDVLGRVNDAASQLKKQSAAAERDIALERSRNNVNARYAEAVRKVAETEHRLNSEANAKVAGTKSAIEMQKLQLAIDQAVLQIEQAEFELKLAALTAQAETIKVHLAEDEIERRQIRAPIGGEIVELHYNAGEWVQPGDTVLRIVQLDRLRVEAFIPVEKLSRGDVEGKPVTVDVSLGRGQTAQFKGRVVFVDPRVQAGGVYQVWAEVENRQVAGHWLLRPGLEAKLTIVLAPAVSE